MLHLLFDSLLGLFEMTDPKRQLVETRGRNRKLDLTGRPCAVRVVRVAIEPVGERKVSLFAAFRSEGVLSDPARCPRFPRARSTERE
jgi:hypothetical protein